jgi:sigma-B regulation protein RsbU (phosphoserine phosphatase)
MTTILIVDDDPTICLLLKRSLERQGYTVEIASNGSEGLEKAHLLVPGLIICDWMMPDMDGLEVCRRIKADPKFSTTFFILLTARTEVEDRIQGLDAGADEFLSKPIDPNELRARVRAGLRLHQLSYDLQQQTARLQAELAEAASYVRSLCPNRLTSPFTR